MRERQLRRFFLSLTALASPVPLALACGGTVVERGDGTGGSGGPPIFAGKAIAGDGGYPMYTGSTAAVGGTGPVYMGLPPNYGSDGGYYGTGGAPPVFTGSGGSTGMPIFYGAGAPATGGGGSYTGGSSGAIFVGQAIAGAGSAMDAGRSADGATDDGGSSEDAGGLSGFGRRPPGLEGAPAGIGADLRGYFQEMARLEAASVPAFRRLRRELGIHGAPASLRAAALRAARDEVVHTRLGRALAERFGGAYVPPRIGRTTVRSLEELAVDNATEGGVRETFGALVATWQSRAATDAVVRRIMRQVAIDETRHAALAIRVSRWTERRLSDEARRRVRDARRSSAADVLRELEWTPPPELVSIAGVPTRSEARRLVRVMTDELWS